MSFALPSPDHPAREMIGDLSHLAEVLNPKNAAALLSLPEARRVSRESFEGSVKPRRVVMVVLRGNDERWLVSFGPRGGWRKEWNFGAGK